MNQSVNVRPVNRLLCRKRMVNHLYTHQDDNRMSFPGLSISISPPPAHRCHQSANTAHTAGKQHSNVPGISSSCVVFQPHRIHRKPKERTQKQYVSLSYGNTQYIRAHTIQDMVRTELVRWRAPPLAGRPPPTNPSSS